VAKEAARAHLAHGDILGSCDKNEDEDDDTPPDEAAPVISNLSASASTTTATLEWSTDEAADGSVWYSLTTPVDTTGDAQVHSATFVESHIASLTNLTASTTYYIVVSSVDEAENVATSSEISFTTLPEIIEEPLDTTAPVITNLSVTAATTTAAIQWDTDEAASSKVWYSTTTPVDFENNPFVSSDTLVTNHTLSLTDLSPETPYYIVVSSTDEAGNEVVSSETSFTTLPEIIEEPADTTAPIISNLESTAHYFNNVGHTKERRQYVRKSRSY